MIKHTQKIFPHDPDNGRWGDCYRTCIACILDQEVEDVPHFVDNGVSTDEIWEATQEWFGKIDMYLVALPFEGIKVEALKAANLWASGNRYLLGGTSPRGLPHMVVGKGNEIEWDPAPPGGDLSDPDEDGYWWIYIIALKL